MLQLKNIALLSLLPATATAFSSKSTCQRSVCSSSITSTSLGVSVVSEFLASRMGNDDDDFDKDLIQAAFETETPESVGVKALVGENANNKKELQQKKKKRTNNKKKPQKSKRKHNYAELQDFLKEVPDLDFFTLHSSAVSHLYLDMPINDITRAIKRAQNRHDAHDLKTIGIFLMEHTDENWGYGFRGTLLSRLAVAALHIDEVELARQAIEIRRVYERASMQPFESVAVVRGLLRAGLKEEGWAVLEDELRLPLLGTSLESPENQEMIKQRAHALSSIATRYFYQGEPQESEKALKKLGELGAFVADSQMGFKDLNMPWERLETAALECDKKMAENGKEPSLTDSREFVWSAMVEFPCPDGEEECSLDSYLWGPLESMF